MMKTGSVQSAVLASLVLMACSGGDSLDWAGTVTDSAGVTIVENPADGLWNVNSGWDVEQELLIGTADGDPDYMFGAISGIAVSANGSIYVLDTQASLIRAFDQSGVLQLSFGTKGGGPGQMQLGAGPILIGAGDTLYVPDIGNQRVNRYTADGTMVGGFPIRMQQGVPFKWEATRSGKIVNQVRRLAFEPDQTPDTMDVVAVRDVDGVAVDTLLQFRSGGTISFSGGAPEIKLFSPEPMWTLASGGGVWHGVNDDYRIGLYEAGSLTRIVTKPFEVAPVAERDIDVIKTAMKNLFQSMGLPPQALQIMEQGMSFGEYFPAYAQFLQGPNGSVWVQHLVVPSELSDEEIEDFNPQLGMGSPDWDVFDDRGRFLGTLTMPTKYQPLSFVGEDIYGIWRDDLDVQYVMKLRITGLPGADTGKIPIAD
jgi:hypothetical protein